jgi:hypothetical protein
MSDVEMLNNGETRLDVEEMGHSEWVEGSSMTLNNEV